MSRQRTQHLKEDKHDVVVIGAGFTGLAAGYELVRRD